MSSFLNQCISFSSFLWGPIPKIWNVITFGFDKFIFWIFNRFFNLSKYYSVDYCPIFYNYLAYRSRMVKGPDSFTSSSTLQNITFGFSFVHRALLHPYRSLLNHCILINKEGKVIFLERILSQAGSFLIIVPTDCYSGHNKTLLQALASILNKKRNIFMLLVYKPWFIYYAFYDFVIELVKMFVLWLNYFII